MQIEVKNLTHVYSAGMPFETTAIEDVSFVVQEGEFAAIIGHTGSGKTTLVQHIAGLIKPSSGEIIADRKKIGIVFQYPEYQLFEESVIKDVCFGPKNLGVSPEECTKRAKKALRLVGVDWQDKGEVSPFNLSGGEKRRVAIAGVLAMEPEVLILDEPTAGLDPQGHDDILDMIARIRRENKLTVILVSHNMDDVANLASHVLVIDKGRLIAEGSPSEIFAQSELLSSVGLGVPSSCEFLNMLKQKGFELETNKFGIEAAAEEIVRAYGN